MITYGANINSASAYAIAQWLNTNPEAVMFVCTDNIDGVAYNSTFESPDGYLEKFTDMFGPLGDLVDITALIEGLQCSFPSGTATSPILAGKFGTVSTDNDFDATDSECGYVDFSTTPLPASVTPLVQTYRNGIEMKTITTFPVLIQVPNLTIIPTRQDEMLMGVDVANRIVYVGESNLLTDVTYSGGALSSTTDLNLLMANTWAWAIDTVLGE